MKRIGAFKCKFPLCMLLVNDAAVMANYVLIEKIAPPLKMSFV